MNNAAFLILHFHVIAKNQFTHSIVETKHRFCVLFLNDHGKSFVQLNGNVIKLNRNCVNKNCGNYVKGKLFKEITCFVMYVYK